VAWQAAAVRAGLSERTVRQVEQAAGRLATQSVARMEQQLSWFRELPAEQRSWVTLVAQAGLQSYVEWLRRPDDVLRLTGEVFAAAPRAMARSVSLQQTVELVESTIAVAEQNLPLLAEPGEQAIVREELLRFSREIAFAAARVYATAAESRGSWDDRLEALVIDGLVRGTEIGDPLPSQLAALGWHRGGAITAIVGSRPHGTPREVLGAARDLARRLGLDAMAGVHGGRLVIVFAGPPEPVASGASAGLPGAGVPPSAAALVPLFGDGPVVVSSPAADPAAASAVTRAALSGLRAVAAWPGAPRPVAADALLPERAIAGDEEAQHALVELVYRPLADNGDVLLGTVSAFLDAGGALEATARALFVHPNTVRYRLRRVADLCGESPSDARGAFALRIAITLGRLADVAA
jgi:hypothetical protein